MLRIPGEERLGVRYRRQDHRSGAASPGRDRYPASPDGTIGGPNDRVRPVRLKDLEFPEELKLD